ncbi:hypothetical protein [Asticcacaulis sp. AC402]|uniref:hypothetical protein n=1 Tax=Asticcacaulis sp. AC402 TaxID=1282361 RepID=UPI0003C3B5F0|nr:hypothetical protein [Asticcacaulis sp. AC402]ESQ76852.1 hypothetical protein ABAC402_04095 [Asticcacaulis sp. AC402]
MPTFLPALVILSAAALAVLIILYRIYESRVEQPKKLEDEVKEALGGARPDVESIEPVRKAACAISYAADKIVIVRNFGKLPTRIYTVADLYGLEVFVDGRIFARVVRAGSAKPLDTGSYKAIDDIAPTVNDVTVRLIFDDPIQPDFQLILWRPDDALTARAEGPRAAMARARKWFHHVEAILRRPVHVKVPPPALHAPVPEPAKVAGPAPASSEPAPALPPAASSSPKKSEGDVLNAPLIPYI